MLVLRCVKCGREFERPGAGGRAPVRPFCSMECRHQRLGEYRTCRRCGRSFYLYPSQIDRAGRTGAYCSRACYGPAIGDRVRGTTKSPEQRARQSAAMRARPSRPRLPPVVVTCLQCGHVGEYFAKKRIHAAVRRFCSTDCWYRYLRTHAEAHNWFKGGYEPYYGPNWVHQAKLARERDGHACRLCGRHQFNPRLDVHHLNARRSFGRDDFEAMNALDNLITVCKSCHTKLELGVVSV